MVYRLNMKESLHRPGTRNGGNILTPRLASLCRRPVLTQLRLIAIRLAGRLVLAMVASIAGSLAADAFLVAVGQAVFPGIWGVTRISSSQTTPNQ
jgi:hypothetical protein